MFHAIANTSTKVTHTRSRKTESIIYAVVWTTIAAVCIMQALHFNSYREQPLDMLEMTFQVLKSFLPFLILFVINNNLLIPRLLLRNRVRLYFLSIGAVLIILWGWQAFDFANTVREMPRPQKTHPPHFIRPILPFPLLLDFIYSLLVTGGNLAIALLFQRFDDKLERESLLKSNAENQLIYLKAQINPHFYMNMLNNIHGMIEIDTEKAQTMVIEMSQLMRYMLYESSQPKIPLSKEIDFIANYLNLMRHRYPSSRVAISARFPDPADAARISIPPLLFLVFIENAFKHGVSYQQKSHITIAITLSSGDLTFTCSNSNHPRSSTPHEQTGIGLNNIRRRLDLLYGSRATLCLNHTDDTFNVTLTIPSA